jgi:hypothetical protein
MSSEVLLGVEELWCGGTRAKEGLGSFIPAPQKFSATRKRELPCHAATSLLRPRVHPFRHLRLWKVLEKSWELDGG